MLTSVGKACCGRRSGKQFEIVFSDQRDDEPQNNTHNTANVPAHFSVTMQVYCDVRVYLLSLLCRGASCDRLLAMRSLAQLLALEYSLSTRFHIKTTPRYPRSIPNRTVQLYTTFQRHTKATDLPAGTKRAKRPQREGVLHTIASQIFTGQGGV